MNPLPLAESTDIVTRGGGFGLLGGLIFTAVVVSVLLLVRNMNKRIKQLPETFDEPKSQG